MKQANVQVPSILEFCIQHLTAEVHIISKEFHPQCFGGVMVMRISSPSLATKCAYTTQDTCGVVAKLPG